MMHHKLGPGEFFDTPFLDGDGRRQRCLCAISLLVLVVVMPAAFAGPSDPTWIPGLYDAADCDDIVLGLIDMSGISVPKQVALAVDALAMGGVIFQLVLARSQQHPAEGIRGPPMIEFASQG